MLLKPNISASPTEAGNTHGRCWAPKNIDTKANHVSTEAETFGFNNLRPWPNSPVHNHTNNIGASHESLRT